MREGIYTYTYIYIHTRTYCILISIAAHFRIEEGVKSCGDGGSDSQQALGRPIRTDAAGEYCRVVEEHRDAVCMYICVCMCVCVCVCVCVVSTLMSLREQRYRVYVCVRVCVVSTLMSLKSTAIPCVCIYVCMYMYVFFSCFAEVKMH